MPKLGPSSDNENKSAPVTETINLEFEGFGLSENDFDGIKQLLGQLFLQYPVDTNELTSHLIENNQVGTVVKNISGDNISGEQDDDATMDSDDDIVFSITSIVNLSLDRDKQCVQQIVDLLKQKCSKGDGNNVAIVKLLNSLDTSKVGLLLNERFVNLPFQLTLKPLEALISEMKAATSRRHRYELTHFLMICKARRMLVEQRAGKRPKAEIVFTNAEDEIIRDEADFVTQFSVSDASTVMPSGDNEDGEPYRTVLMFTADKFHHIINKLKMSPV